ncbi:MAG: DNA-directed RNA polymerase subunit alpha [Saprospiraceae bacterium]|jgi:DNA-directed RNA polymerase subunit alpha|nr:DNA-directed RNA polymerase subunit alpha [Saprospiraceae bacterium]MCA0333746.1 DNA-directed RNA polymerase subunit alpha [Bacteroidota bacterium]MCB0604555.1 DNA-directed RNA polymerase subunit alpha [Saprospiraceae bacterium]MCO5277130.1 DNA-directed RNA polymerase subunit alpha [Saprospiraceae bacterium]HMT77220.1 DNA-directed RNA polymerase subunit alpha [Saprospiraceae bacterium]
MSILNFQKPEKIILQKATDFDGIFEFKPLEPGFGQTIGNSLRRVLLNSLEGFAISAIRIGGVDHEFTTIPGVVEDVIEIILNLKQVRLKLNLNDEDITNEKIYLTLRGKEEFKSGDIEQFTNVFKVMNPDLLICHMDPSVTLEIELTINKGRGYVPADEQPEKDNIIGVIPIDSIYTPVKNVAYRVSNTRVGQRTDYEKLTIEVKTDGTIHPEDAVKEASRILIHHLMLITDENISFDDATKSEENVVDEHILHMRKLLKTTLEDLDLSVRAYNCLKAAKINSLGEMVQYETHELLKFRNFGKKSLVEIEELLTTKGLHFGMDLAKYKLDEE